MNIYFLVEGQTECIFYPKLVEYVFNDLLIKVDYPIDAISNNYYLIGNGGYPFIYTGPKYPVESAAALKNAILDVNAKPVYDYLVVCLDADELTVEERVEEFNRYVNKYAQEGIALNEYCRYVLVVQNRCIETWFLGNKKAYKRNPSSEPLISYTRYFNVSKEDPEVMDNYSREFSPQDFHLQYLREMVREKIRKSYKKETPHEVIDELYIEEIVKRAYAKNRHLKSLFDFLSFLYSEKDRIIKNI